MRHWVFDPVLGERDDDTFALWDGFAGQARVLQAQADGPDPLPDEDPGAGDSAGPEDAEAPEVPVQAVTPDDDTAPVSAIQDDADTRPIPPDQIDTAQLFRDRPDVFAAYFTEFHGPNNDRHSDAWTDRVGGSSPEDFARYWYKSYGVWEGYRPGASTQSAPDIGHLMSSALEGEGSGRTTADGIGLAQILRDRPDVFQGFFTEFYGANNDQHSSAWMNRVGGNTPQDYANYWYETYGRYSGYTPSNAAPEPASPEPEEELQPPADDGMDLPPPLLDEPPVEAVGGEDGPPAEEMVIIPVGQSLPDDGLF